MKKWKEAMKTKGIYIVSLFGTITILAVAAIAMNLMENSTKNGPEVDLNETPGIVSEQREDTELAKEPLQSETQSQENRTEQEEYTIGQNDGQEGVPGKDSLLQDVVEQKINVPDKSDAGTDSKEGSSSVSHSSGIQPHTTDEQNVSVIVPEEQLTGEASDLAKNTEANEELQEVSGMNPETVIRNLSFLPEQGIAWPINGAVVLNYSTEHAIYHATLDSYRTSDGILISGEEGMPICAAVRGVVTAVTEELKTGTTVTMRISEEYSIRYGQLANVTVKVGDVVEEGENFAVLGKPSKYYTKEGTCLYVQILKGETPVNPMLYLRDEQ